MSLDPLEARRGSGFALASRSGRWLQKRPVMSDGLYGATAITATLPLPLYANDQCDYLDDDVIAHCHVIKSSSNHVFNEWICGK